MQRRGAGSGEASTTCSGGEWGVGRHQQRAAEGSGKWGGINNVQRRGVGSGEASTTCSGGEWGVGRHQQRAAEGSGKCWLCARAQWCEGWLSTWEGGSCSASSGGPACIIPGQHFPHDPSSHSPCPGPPTHPVLKCRPRNGRPCIPLSLSPSSLLSGLCRAPTGLLALGLLSARPATVAQRSITQHSTTPSVPRCCTYAHSTTASVAHHYVPSVIQRYHYVPSVIQRYHYVHL